MEIQGVPEHELEVRTQAGRHMARIASDSQQDAASAFCSAFTMSFDRVRQIYEVVHSRGALEAHAGPLTEIEREYLSTARGPRGSLVRYPDQEHEIVVEFKAAAEKYMQVIDSAEGRDADAFLIDTARTLAPLVAVAYRLPDIWDDDWTFSAETNESAEESVDRLREMTRPLIRVLEERDDYVTVVAFGWDAPKSDADAELLGGWLAHDLVSIYGDIEDGLHLLAEGGTEGEAIYTWHWGFWSHWGEHAVDALRIVHAHAAPSHGGSTVIGTD